MQVAHERHKGERSEAVQLRRERRLEKLLHWLDSEVSCELRPRVERALAIMTYFDIFAIEASEIFLTE